MSLRVAQPNARFLIVSLRSIGDVLLSNPLARSIKEQYPQATVDYLVYTGHEGVLAKNPHVRRVYTVDSGGARGFGMFLQLWKKYDFSIGISAADRTTIFCFGAGRKSVGFVPALGGNWWKRMLLTESRVYAPEKHVVQGMLDLLEPLGIKPLPRVVAHFDASDKAFVEQKLGAADYVLLHPYTRRSCKYWPATAWAELAKRIREETGLRALFSRGIGPQDEAQLAEIRTAAGGSLDCFPEPFYFNQLAAAIRKARVYVGVDTVATHLAAALDVPVVTLFGPTPADRWGPWPNDCSSPAPYVRTGGTQHQGHVTLLQQAWPCVPCDKETCAITKRGKIECLEQLSLETVLQEVKRKLAVSPSGG